MRHNLSLAPPDRAGTAARALLALAMAAACVSGVQARERASAQWRVDLENDMWGDRSDGHYTHGTRISRLNTSPARWIRRVARRLPCPACRDPRAVEWTLGQDLYTPEATWRSERVDRDRPYAGWLFGGVRFHRGEHGPRAYRVDSAGIDLGVVGPAALAEQTQSMIHEALGKPVSRGWAHQLNDEPGVVLNYRREWHHQRSERPFTYDVAPFVSGAFGNVFTHLSAGVSLKSGANFRAHRLAEPARGTGWHAFLDLEARAVGRNIFLDGNTREPSHRVEKKSLVGEIRGGIACTLGRFGVTFTTAVRSREFVGQRKPDRYGGLSFTYRP